MNQFNNKRFLAPDSINSMAVVQTKIHEDGIAVLRISDCHRSIKIWNNLNNENERNEMIEKLSILQQSIENLKNEVLKVDYDFQKEKGLTEHQKKLMKSIDFSKPITFQQKERR